MSKLDYVKNYVSQFIGKKLDDRDVAIKIRDFILNLDIKDNTKKYLLVNIKPFIKDNKMISNTEYLDIINSRELYVNIINNSNKKREDKGVIGVDMNIVEKLLKLKCNKKLNPITGYYEYDKYSLYIYLLFTSGLRTNEITENDFSIVDKNTIKPKRISKKEYDETDVIKLLIPSSEWITLFNTLQNIIKDEKLTQSTLSSGITRKLKSIQTGLTGHTLRKLFLAYHLQIKKTDADKLPSVATKKLLNHTNENSSLYYNGAVKITGELKDVIDNRDFTKMKVAELKDVLKSKNISYTSKMKKTELIKLLTC
jgi:integrase